MHPGKHELDVVIALLVALRATHAQAPPPLLGHEHNQHIYSARSCSTQSALRFGRGMRNETSHNVALQRCTSKEAECIDFLFVWDDAAMECKLLLLLHVLCVEIKFVRLQCVYVFGITNIMLMSKVQISSGLHLYAYQASILNSIRTYLRAVRCELVWRSYSPMVYMHRDNRVFE